MRLSSLLVVVGLAVIPSFALVETVDVPVAQADFIPLQKQIARLNIAISKLKDLANQVAPANMTKEQMQAWNAQSKLTNEVLAQLNDWHEKLTECLKRAQNKEAAQSGDEKILANFQAARKQMIEQFQFLSPNTPAGKARTQAALQAFGQMQG